MASSSTSGTWSFLHAADLHLDTPMPGRDDSQRRALRSALRDAFERLVELAIEERVRTVLLAGDIVDGARLSLATEDLLVDRLRRLGEENIQVFIAPGNHDHYRTGSPMHRIRWPENVHLFRSIVPESVPLLDTQGNPLATVHGVGHTSPRQSENLVKRISGHDETVPQIGLVHTHIGHVDLSGRHQPYAPSEIDDFSGRGIDYWAVGHVHSYKELSRAPWVVYPGCCMGRDIGETGPKGCVLVRVYGRDDMECEFRPLAPITFHFIEIDISELQEIPQFFDAVRARWRDIPTTEMGDEGQILRVAANGRGPLADHFREAFSLESEEGQEIQERLERTLGVGSVEFIDRSVPPLELESIGEEVSVRGEYIRLLREMIRDPRERRAFTESVEWLNPDWKGLSEEERSVYVREILRASLIEGVDRLSDRNEFWRPSGN